MLEGPHNAHRSNNLEKKNTGLALKIEGKVESKEVQKEDEKIALTPILMKKLLQEGDETKRRT